VDPTPALVLCGSKAGLAVTRGLGRMGIPVVAVCFGRGQIAAASRHATAREWSPDPNEDEAAFLEFLVDLAGKWAGAAVFPTDDASLMAVSKHKERLSGRYRVVAEDWAVVRRLLEKVHTYAIAERHGVPCPRVRMIGDVDEALELAREVGFPCIVKPSLGHAFFKRHRAKMVFARSPDELRGLIDRFGPEASELMLSEFIPGDDTCGTNYNSFYVDGQPRQEFTAEKIRLKPARIGFPTAVVSRWRPEVAEHGRRMIRAVGYRGFSCTEFKRDERDGVHKLMEVNARHNYSGALALACGINFPYLSYLDALGETVPTGGRTQEEGVRWIDEERDIGGAVAAARAGAGAAWAYLEPYARRRVFAVFSAADPLPSLRLAGEALRGLRGHPEAAPSPARVRAKEGAAT
jgi:predicted ATP-grasp superfamily ATP-dependent carboligase